MMGVKYSKITGPILILTPVPSTRYRLRSEPESSSGRDHNKSLAGRQVAGWKGTVQERERDRDREERI